MNVKSRHCLVVGAGKVAARKIRLLIKSQAKITIVAPHCCDEISKMNRLAQVCYIQREFVEQDLEKVILVFAATNNQQVNQWVSALCQQQALPVNVVDQTDLCSFIMPSIVDRSPVQIAISTSGTSPVLAKLLRTRLETLIPAQYGQLAKLVKGFRKQVSKQLPDAIKRRLFWENILQGKVAKLVFAGNQHNAKKELEQAIEQIDKKQKTLGEVALVGAGPGDPELLTLKALRLMQQADVVVYDRLVSHEILDLVRRDAELIYVGKENKYHVLEQESINFLLVRLVKEGKQVVRLKGGDPFIFGRGGEEIETLKENQITFQVVPGITAASGCSTYAGIPLTHRDYAQSCLFVTGHLQKDSKSLNWKSLANPKQTIVFYMGLQAVALIHENLVANGLDKQTPVAIIEQGTTENQRVHIATLASIARLVEKNNIKPPSLIIVGKVVKLHKSLQWFAPLTKRGSSFQLSKKY